jgi:hypothetical protein
MRGRPVKSKIRQNIVEILFFMKKGYGYDVYKSYVDIFAPVTLRSIYYNLRKGEKLKEFVVKEVKKEKGDYSWGAFAEKVYYALGENAKPSMPDRVRKYFEKKKKK